MSNSLKAAMGIVAMVVATHAAAQVTFYSRDGFRGESFVADRQITNMERTGFNDRAQSAVVQSGTWQVCEDSVQPESHKSPRSSSSVSGRRDARMW